MRKIIFKKLNKNKQQILNPPQRGPKPVKEEAEFGLGKEEFVFCSGCGIVYYHKSWHHQLADWKHFKETKKVKFSLCPACQMIKDRKFEGELTIVKIKNEKIKEEIKKVLKNSGDLAFQRDPLDRIIEIRETKDQLIVYTTENQLAVKLAKKIKSVFDALVEIIHSQEDVIRVRVIIKDKKEI